MLRCPVRSGAPGCRGVPGVPPWPAPATLSGGRQCAGCAGGVPPWPAPATLSGGRQCAQCAGCAGGVPPWPAPATLSGGRQCAGCAGGVPPWPAPATLSGGRQCAGVCGGCATLASPCRGRDGQGCATPRAPLPAPCRGRDGQGCATPAHPLPAPVECETAKGCAILAADACATLSSGRMRRGCGTVQPSPALGTPVLWGVRHGLTPMATPSHPEPLRDGSCLFLLENYGLARAGTHVHPAATPVHVRRTGCGQVRPGAAPSPTLPSPSCGGATPGCARVSHPPRTAANPVAGGTDESAPPSRTPATPLSSARWSTVARAWRPVHVLPYPMGGAARAGGHPAVHPSSNPPVGGHGLGIHLLREGGTGLQPLLVFATPVLHTAPIFGMAHIRIIRQCSCLTKPRMASGVTRNFCQSVGCPQSSAGRNDADGVRRRLSAWVLGARNLRHRQAPRRQSARPVRAGLGSG